MHDLLEARCAACGFSVKGLDVLRASRQRACALCGGRVTMRSNLNVSRRLPAGTCLLIGAFAASLDANPLLAPEVPLAPGFARHTPLTLG